MEQSRQNAVEAPDASTPGQDMSNWSRTLVVLATGLAIFVSCLDATMVATLVPTLVRDFQAVSDAGWYGSVYLLVSGATQPTMGKLYATFAPKHVFLLALGLVEMGSLICALAKNSPAFIGGRAVAGLGCAGIISGGLTITALVAPLHQRPVYVGILGSLEGVALIIGPIIGGAIASNIGWRWCFWINLPVGAVVCLLLILFLHIPSPQSTTSSSSASPSRSEMEMKESKTSLKHIFIQLDLVGGILITACILCLLLAVQWAGTKYPWNDGRIIALFVLFGVLLVGAVVHQRWKGDTATIPGRLLRNRLFNVSLFNGLCMSSAQYSVLYYLPLWFQFVQGDNAQQSGIHTLPMMISVIFVALVSGLGVSRWGYTAPFSIGATVLGSVGAGMLYTLAPNTSVSQWIGYQILFGSGSGTGIQHSIIGAQVAVADSPDDIALAMAAVMMVNTVGGAIFICVCQNLFLSEAQKLDAILPGLDLDALLVVSGDLSSEDLEIVRDGYNMGVRKAFFVVMILCAATALGWPFLSWKPIKKGSDDAAVQNTKEKSTAG